MTEPAEVETIFFDRGLDDKVIQLDRKLNTVNDRISAAPFKLVGLQRICHDVSVG